MQLSTQSILLLLMFTTSLTHGEMFTAQQTEEVVNLVNALIQCRDAVGLTMAVVNGNDIWTRGFGMADRERGVEVSSSHLFNIASVTKGVTSALLSVFFNNTNRYSWQTPVADILGGDFQFVNEELTQQVTLEDLLVHRTGLATTDMPEYAGLNLTSAEFARRIRHLPAKQQFRKEFEYNNWMYGLVGRVTEVLGGAPWEDLLHARLLRPLQMSSTGVLGKTVSMQDDKVVKPYVYLDGETVLSDPSLYSIGPYIPAGAITSSADDMVKWMQLLLNKGWSETGGRMLSETHVREMMSAHIDLPLSFGYGFSLWNPPYPVNVTTDRYGYGWKIASYRGYPLTWHFGNLYAYNSVLAFLPQHNVSVFIGYTGRATLIADQIFYYVADLLLHEEPWFNSSNACQFPEPWVEKSTDTQTSEVYEEAEFHIPNHYTGRYGHPLYGSINVMRNGSHGLYVQYDRLEGRLFGGEKEHVAMWEIQGRLAFEFRKGSKPYYLQLTFSRPSGEGLFRRLMLSDPWKNEELVFDR